MIVKTSYKHNHITNVDVQQSGLKDKNTRC